MMKQVRILITMLLGVLVAYWAQPDLLLAQGPNKAALVVRSGDQQVQTACVEFSEPQISGLDLILRSGLDITIEAQGMGALVCRIEGTGCDAGDCWCQCKGGGDCVYWSYWHQVNGNWQYGQIGSTMVQVGNGAVQGWSWGPGSVNAAIAPPVMSFDDVCNPSSGEPTVTPKAAIVVTPQPTAVPATSAPVQTATAIPATSTPTPQPTATSVNTVIPSPAPAQMTVTSAPLQPTAVPTEAQVEAVLPAQSVEPVVVAQADLPTATPRTRDVADPPAALVEVPVQEVLEPPPATAVPPARIESDRAKIAAAPGPTAVPQVTVIGAGYAPPSPPLILPAQIEDTSETDGLSYLVFLILAGFLTLFLLYTRLRGEPE
jgi:hypothetical protein